MRKSAEREFLSSAIERMPQGLAAIAPAQEHETPEGQTSRAAKANSCVFSGARELSEGPSTCAKSLKATADAQPKLSEGQRCSVTEAGPAVPSGKPTELPGEGHSAIADKAALAAPIAGQPDLASTIAAIRYSHRMRVFAMDQRKRLDLSLGAMLRTSLGWSRALPDAERKRIAAQAQALIDMGEKQAKGKPVDVEEPAYDEWRDIIMATLAARGPFDAIEAQSKKHMAQLAESLPVWKVFGEGVKGFGAVSLAVIVAEAGDLSTYPKKGHLWKRMGVAVMGAGDGVSDVRQGGLSKSAAKADWIRHGYSAKRRSLMFVIGDVLVKNKGVYRGIYLRRKEYERERAIERGLTVAPAGKIPAARRDEFISDGHIHKRAQRYMEKRLLRDLWQAWRDCEPAASQSVPDGPCRLSPGSQPDCASEAIVGMPDRPWPDRPDAQANCEEGHGNRADVALPRLPSSQPERKAGQASPADPAIRSVPALRHNQEAA